MYVFLRYLTGPEQYETFILLLYPIRDYSVACIKNVYLILL